MALLPPPAVARPGVVELTVTAPRAVREIGVAWLDGHPDTPPVAEFKRFLLSRRGRLIPELHGWHPGQDPASSPEAAGAAAEESK